MVNWRSPASGTFSSAGGGREGVVGVVDVELELELVLRFAVCGWWGHVMCG